MDLLGVVLFLCVCLPLALCFAAGLLMGSSARSRDDRRAHRLGRALRRWRLQKAAKSELEAAGKAWEVGQ